MGGAVRIQNKVGKLVSGNGLVVSDLENINVVKFWGDVIAVILGVINRVIRAPFDNKTALLDEGATLVKGKRFNASNGSVGNRECGPAVTGDPSTSGQGHEIVVTLGVPCG